MTAIHFAFDDGYSDSVWFDDKGVFSGQFSAAASTVVYSCSDSLRIFLAVLSV